MLQIAHRGLWRPDLQNTVEAMQRAVDRGFGIEIDVRITGTELWVGHDPAPGLIGPSLNPFENVFAAAPLIFWNIKMPGMAQPLADFIFQHHLQEKSIIFDQDFPGMPEEYSGEFLSRGLKVLARISDREPESHKVVGSAFAGVWLDQFDVDWVYQDVIDYFHDKGLAVFVVSPELHGRPLNLQRWFEWKDADGICTDFPGLLFQLLGEPDHRLFPANPWWHKEEWLQSVADAQRSRE